MHLIRPFAVALGLVFLCAGSSAAAQTRDDGAPQLRKQGTATQLVVDGAPFLIRGGELGNSTAWMNGDQTNQGRHIQLGAQAFSMQRVKLYRYR